MIPSRRFFSRFLIFSLSLWLSFATSAQTTRPERVGLSSQRLASIDTLMQEKIDNGEFSGAVTLVARDNKIAWFHAQGVMDIDSGRPMQKDTVFRIMSMTKPVVAFSILMMIEEGRVRLDDPVSRFIPELGSLNVAGAGQASRDITVLDLLTHTSGLMSGPQSNRGVSVDFSTGGKLGDIIPTLGKAPLEFEPGSRWAYSPMYGFDVLARIVEITSGLDFGTFIQSRIFDPLGMENTFFYRDTPHPNLTTLYRNDNGKLVKNPESFFMNGAYFSGGGGLSSTAEDYLQFALVLLNDGEYNGKRLLGRRSVEIMRTAFIDDSLPGRNPGEGFGLGVRVITDPAANRTWLSEGTFGWSGAFNTHFFVDPSERLVAIYMTQISGAESRFTLRKDFETAVMQAIVE